MHGLTDNIDGVSPRRLSTLRQQLYRYLLYIRCAARSPPPSFSQRNAEFFHARGVSAIARGDVPGALSDYSRAIGMGGANAVSSNASTGFSTAILKEAREAIGQMTSTMLPFGAERHRCVHARARRERGVPSPMRPRAALPPVLPPADPRAGTAPRAALTPGGLAPLCAARSLTSRRLRRCRSR